MLIRYSVTALKEDPSSENAPEIYDMLVKSLRHYNDVCIFSFHILLMQIVCFEAARALVSLPDVRNEDLTPVVSMLRIHLGSSKAVTKFAAVRILNQVSLF